MTRASHVQRLGDLVGRMTGAAMNPAALDGSRHGTIIIPVHYILVIRVGGMKW
jgi:hypothetical protein